MNINLTRESVIRKRKLASKSNENLSFGLNNRNPKSKSKAAKHQSIFDDDDSDSDASISKGAGNSTTHTRNSDLVAEQEALRRRTQAFGAAANDAVYDYDAEYEQFSSSRKMQEAENRRKKQHQQNQREGAQNKAGSRYIANLLKTAKDREREREIIYERKMAKEQIAEDANEEYKDKEKLITSAYRRKLEERKMWEHNDKIREAQERENDVTKKGPEAIATFYGNFSRNIAVGGRNPNSSNFNEVKKDVHNEEDGNDLERRERDKQRQSQDRYLNKNLDTKTHHHHSTSREKSGANVKSTKSESTVIEHEQDRKKDAVDMAKARSIRAEKLAAARERYFKRRNIKDQ